MLDDVQAEANKVKFKIVFFKKTPNVITSGHGNYQELFDRIHKWY